MSKRIIYRDSESGKLTTREYATQHPKTTERERVNVPTPKKK
ncbi:hypothetical protein [Fibrella forsythiae]|nr:hypothetical protein [Fibrella forsythiae]